MYVNVFIWSNEEMLKLRKGECITVRDGERILESNMGNQYDKGKTGYYSSTWKEVKYICREKNGRSTRCERTEYLPITDYPMNTYDKYLDKFYCSINGSSEWPCFRAVDWTWRVRSMVVPRGLTAYVKQYSKVLNKENLQKMKRDYGPYTGPQVASNLPPFASEMRIVDTDSSKLQIRLCTEPNLKGQCGEETINVRKVDEEGKQTIDLTKGINNIPFHMFKLHEEPWGAMGHAPETTELRSVKIPDGYDIIRYTRKEDKTEVLSDTLSGYVKNIHSILDSGRKAFKLEVKKKSETRFKAATVKDKEDTIF